MNTNFKKLLLPLAFIGAALMYWSFNWPLSTGPAISGGNATYNTALNRYEFHFPFVSGSLPNPADSFDNSHILIVPLANDFDNWKVFATFDDGTFWMGRKSDFDAKGFVFSRSGSHTITTELTPTYDDGNTTPPAGFSKNFSVGTGQTVAGAEDQRKQTLPTSNPYVQLISSLSPRKGDVLTYVITYQNPNNTCPMWSGTLKFFFDPTVINYDHCEVYLADRSLWSGTIPQASENVGGFAYGRLYIPFNNLAPGEQRNVFVRCTTASNVTTSTPYHTPWVEFSGNSDLGCDKHTEQSALPSQSITSSHDPNHKWAVQQQICHSDHTVDFTVTFQNDGPDEVNDIVVTDELHQLLKNQSPQLIAWPPLCKPTITPPGADRKVNFNFSSAHLHGLQEPGLGTRFSEADTRISFTFRCDLDESKTPDFPCNAILNRASIRFKCNPPIETDDAMAPLLCTACDTCTILASDTIRLDTIHPEDGLGLINSNVDAILTSHGFAGSQMRYIWYPASDLVDANVLHAQYNNSYPKSSFHTLVASGSNPCERRILHMILGHKTCDLGIQIDASNVTVDPCTGTASGTITATATGSFSQNLEWHDCTQHLTSITIPVVSDKMAYYFGVTDKDNWCSAELIYVIKMPPCKTTTGGGVISWPVLSALIAAVLAVFWWLRRFFKKKHNLPENPSSH